MQAFIGVILGQRGAGKSTMLFETMVPLCDAPVFILDTLGGDVEYGVHYNSTEGLAKDFMECMAHCGVYVLNSSSDEESDKFFRMVRALGEGGFGPITVIIDEIDKFCTPHTVQPDLDYLVRYGRRYGVNFLLVARRVGEVNKGIRSQSDFFVSFRQIEPGDVQAIKERSAAGADAVRELSMYRTTGEHSEYIVIGDLPTLFNPIKNHTSHKTITQ